MTRGDTRRSSGRESNFGRRLRVGAVGTVAIGGAIFMGGAATLVTAFANTGAVSATQNCTTFSVAAHLDNNVDHRLVTVTFPNTSTSVVDKEFTTTSSGATDIFTKTGNAPATGTVDETIYNGNTVASGIEAHYSATLPAPSECTASITTTPSAGGPVGTSIHDSATVTGTAGTPTGTVVFKLFAPDNSTCNSDGSAAVYTSPAETLSGGQASSGSYVTAAVGTYHWVAHYSGDNTYNAATSQCADEAVTTTKGGPSIATVAGAGGRVPVDVSDSATVSGGVNPTGTVTFTLYPSVADCNAGTNAVGAASTVALSGGKATSGAVHVTTAGTYQWIAKYSGDANNASASSACGDEPVTTTSGGGGGVQGITTPSTGNTGSLIGITIGGFLLLGGLAVTLVGSILPRRRRSIQ